MLRLFALPKLLLAATVGLVTAGPALADGLQEEPLARFEEPVCPGVIGLKVAAAEQMVGRIRANAAGFGLRLADPEACEPNLIVTFLTDGQDYLQRLEDKRPYLFQEMSTADRRALLAETGPARAWINTQVRTRDGFYVGRGENLTQPPNAGMWSAHSRIYRPVREDISSAMVLFDSAAVGGLSVEQLADYATMRGLANTFPDEAGTRQPSILTLFDEPGTTPTPLALTAFDRTYLGRLYEGLPNLPASARLNGLPVEAARIEE